MREILVLAIGMVRGRMGHTTLNEYLKGWAWRGLTLIGRIQITLCFFFLVLSRWSSLHPTHHRDNITKQTNKQTNKKKHLKPQKLSPNYTEKTRTTQCRGKWSLLPHLWLYFGIFRTKVNFPYKVLKNGIPLTDHELGSPVATTLKRCTFIGEKFTWEYAIFFFIRSPQELHQETFQLKTFLGATFICQVFKI